MIEMKNGDFEIMIIIDESWKKIAKRVTIFSSQPNSTAHIHTIKEQDKKNNPKKVVLLNFVISTDRERAKSKEIDD